MWRAYLFFPFMLFAGWAEDVLSQMTLEQKVGQLFVAPCSPLRDEDHWEDWKFLMDQFSIGSALVKQADIVSQQKFLNRLQNESKFPLLVAADYEWGLGMTMKDGMSFPKNMTLGAIEDVGLIYELGREIGRQARAVGVHLNLAPVADVNNNPENPIIHMRSFGEDAFQVAERANAYAQGIQSVGVLACLKHFPGHGSTTVDSHQGLPILHHTKERLDRIEFVPFRKAIQEGVAVVMSGHLFIPHFDSLYPATLSEFFLRDCLKNELGFEGIVISDALNMKALSESFTPERIAFLARKAGCDLLLYGAHRFADIDELIHDQIPRAYRFLLYSYRVNHLQIEDLDRSVLKILKAKEKVGLSISREVPIGAPVSTAYSSELKRRLYEEAIVEIGDFSWFEQETAYVSVNSGEIDLLAQKFPFTFRIKGTDIEEIGILKTSLSYFPHVLIALHKVDAKAPNFGLAPELFDMIQGLSSRSCLVLFCTPYALQIFPNASSFLVAFEDDREAQAAVLDILQGRKKAKGRLPTAFHRDEDVLSD